jgi:hypothetical protein
VADRGKQPLAGAEDGGEGQQAVLVNQVPGHQRVHDAQAAGDDHIPRLVLDGRIEVAVDDAGVRPGRRAGQDAEESLLVSLTSRVLAAVVSRRTSA